MKKLIVFIMLATIPFLLGFFGIGMPELIVILVILGIIGLPILIIILIINAKKEGVPAQSVQAGKFCSNCGKEIAPNAYFCSGCGVKLVQEPLYEPSSKPLPRYDLKRSTEQVVVSPDIVEYAGFWKRLAALVIDYILVIIATSIVCFVFGLSINNSKGGVSILAAFIGWLYQAAMESSSKQATLGKIALGIIVTDYKGRRISFGRATGRHFAKCISWVILFIGYIMAGFTKKKQALHDMIAECLVVVKKKQKFDLERESHHESEPPPYEPPPKSEKEKTSTTGNEGHGGFQPLLERSLSPQVILILGIILSGIIISIIWAVVYMKNDADRTNQTVSSQNKGFNLPQPPSKTEELSATDWYNKGYSFQSSGNYKEAIDAYDRAIDLVQFSKFYAYRGSAYYKLGDFQQAIRDCSKAIELNPGETMAYHYRGSAFYMKSEYDNALEDLNKSISIDADDLETRYYRGCVFLEKHRFDEALGDFDKLISTNPNGAQGCNGYIGRWRVFYRKAQYDKALEDVNKAIAIDPNNPTAYLGRGWTNFQKSENDKAIEDFSKAIAIDPNNPTAYFGRGLTNYKKSEYENAIEDFSKAIAINPNYADAHLYRGSSYRKKNQDEKALEDFNKAIFISPEDDSAYVIRGMFYYKKGLRERAIEDFSKAISMNPKKVSAYDNRGYVYLDLGKYQQAINDFQKSIQLDEKSLDGHIGLSIVFFRQKRIEQAKIYYQKAIDIEPISKGGADALEREKGYFYTTGQKQTINEILKLF